MNNLLLDPLTIALCGTIVLVAFFFGIRLLYSTRRLVIQLGDVNSELKQLKPISSYDEEGEVIEPRWNNNPLTIAYQNREKMHNKISATECLKTPWDAYQRSMQLPNENFQLNEGEAPSLRNTMQVKSIFNMEEVVESQMNIRLFTSVPNMLTGLGLLFTFVGLVIGISGASAGLSSANSEDARQSLYPLLSGASIAFTTSIVGIICSMIFSVFEKNRFFKLENEVKQFSSYLATHIEFIDSDKLAAMQLTAIEAQTKALTNFQVDQQRITDETIRRVSEEFRETLLDNAGSEIKELAALISEMNQSMGSNLVSFTENQIKVGNATEELTNTLQTSIVSVTEQLRSSADEMGVREEERISRVVKTFEDAGNDVARVIGNCTADIEEQLYAQSKTSLGNIKQASDVFTRSMSESAQLLETIPDKITSASEQSIQESAQQLQILMDQKLENIGERSAAIEKQLQSQSESSLENIKQASEWFGKTMADSAKLLEDIPGKITLASEQSVKESSQQLQSLMTELMPETVAQVSSSLGQQVNSLMLQVGKAENNLGNILGEFPELTIQLKKLNQELLGNAQVIGKLHESTRVSLSDFNNTSDSMRESIAQMSEANTHSAELAKNYSALLNGIQEVAKDVSDSSGSSKDTIIKLQHMLEQQSNVGNTIKEALDSSLTQLHTGLIDYAKLTNEHMSSLDQDASKVSSHLVEAIQEVNILVKDIALANNRMSGAV
jgi:ABC-type transporter Mla subunit MlaD